MARSKVDNRDFVVAWTTSRTTDDVMAATGLSKPAISARAKYLKSKGVKLKKLERPSMARLDTLEVAQLNSLINKYSEKK